MTKILVTGGNGFLAAQVLVAGLKKGYEVVATVRSEQRGTQTKDAVTTKANHAFDNVLQAHQFDAVIHPAANVTLGARPEDIVQPTIDSTVNLLQAVKEFAPNVKRVIITGTLATVVDFSKGARPGYTYTEKDWNPVTWEDAVGGDSVAAYYGAKTFAEKAAWEFIEKENPQFELVILIPPMIFGEVAQPIGSAESLNASTASLYQVLTSRQLKKAVRFGVVFVNVKDLANAHIVAVDSPKAGNKRLIICSDKPYSKKLIAEAFIKHYPELASSVDSSIPEGLDEQGFPPGGVYRASNSLSKRILGIEYQDLEETMKQFVESVKPLLGSI